MFKKIFFLGLTVGIMAAIAAIIYNRVYHFANEADFSKLVNTKSLIAANLGAGIIIALGYWACMQLLKKNGDTLFNFILTLLSFASIILPISLSLPLDISNPELFPGLAIPMHFFPAMGWFTLKPLFIKDLLPSKGDS